VVKVRIKEGDECDAQERPRQAPDGEKGKRWKEPGLIRINENPTQLFYPGGEPGVGKEGPVLRARGGPLRKGVNWGGGGGGSIRKGKQGKLL